MKLAVSNAELKLSLEPEEDQAFRTTSRLNLKSSLRPSAYLCALCV